MDRVCSVGEGSWSAWWEPGWLSVLGCQVADHDAGCQLIVVGCLADECDPGLCCQAADRCAGQPRTDNCYSNRIARAGAMRLTIMLGMIKASTHTNNVPMFSSAIGPRSRSTGTLST